MKNKENQSQADIYRQERKERLAKNAQKKARKTPEAIKRILKLRKIFGSALAVVLGLLIIYGVTNFFSVPQKLLTALDVNGKKVSTAEYNYYYISAFTNLYQTASQYEQQGEGFGAMMTNGFNYKISPDKQSTSNKDGQNITFSEYIDESVKNSIAHYKYFYDKAIEAGTSLSDEKQKEIDDAIESLRETAKENNFSLNRFLNAYYGKGLNEKLFKKIATEQYIVAEYLEQQHEDKASSITSDEVEAVYNENPADYNLVSIRFFGIPLAEEKEDADEDKSENKDAENKDKDKDTKDEDSKDKDEPTKAEKQIKEMMSKVTDEESFVELCKEYAPEKDKEIFENDEASLFSFKDFETIQNATDEKTAKWIFDKKRAEGEMTTLVADDYAYLIYVIEPSFKPNYKPVTVRHSLVQFKLEEGKTEKDMTEKEKAEYLKKAEDFLAEWKKGPKTEESFAELANKHSDDQASIIGPNQEYKDDPKGGLYENIEKGTMVLPFENWIFDAKRKTGDTGIVETSYGYHIMYFVKQADEAAYETSIKEKIADDFMHELQESSEEEYESSTKGATFASWAFNKVRKFINRNYYLGA